MPSENDRVPFSQLPTADFEDTSLIAHSIPRGEGAGTAWLSRVQTLRKLASHIFGTSSWTEELSTTSKTIFGAINEIAVATGGVVVSGTLLAGQTTITFTNAAISSNSRFDFYTDTFGVNPTAVSVSGTTLAVTFAAQANDLGVLVEVK